MKKLIVVLLVGFSSAYGAAYLGSAIASKKPDVIAKLLFVSGLTSDKNLYKQAVLVSGVTEALEKVKKDFGGGTGTGGGELIPKITEIASKSRSAALVAVVTGIDVTDPDGKYSAIEDKAKKIAGPKVLANISGADAMALAKAMVTGLPKV